jgi:hypothetical protein
VAAPWLALFRAVIFAILVRRLLVEWMATGNLGALFFKLSLSSLRLRKYVFVVVQRLRDGS